MRDNQQAGRKLLGMFIEQALFAALFNVASQQDVLIACADAQHTTLVIIVWFGGDEAVASGVQDLELYAVPVPVFAMPAAASLARDSCNGFEAFNRLRS